LSDYAGFICDPSNLQTVQIADLVIESVSNHLNSGCKCIPVPRARFTIANAKFSLFFLRLESFAATVAAYESIHCNKFFEMISTPDEKSDNGHVTSVRQSKTASRFDPNPLKQFVNMTSHEKLVQPLIEAIDEWELGISDSDFKTSDAESLRISEYLLTAFNVCHLYKLIRHQETCARLARKAASPRKSNEILSSHCMNLQLALAVADQELCDRSVRLGSEVSARIKTTGETFETVLFFLLKCDYEIRRGIFTSAPTLTSLIASDYLKKLTVNRFYLKASAVYMASKFPANEISPSVNFQYFVETQESMYMLLKRWHRKVFDPISTDVKKDDLTDPLWLRYAAYDLFARSFIVHSRFHINCGTPLESEFYHNVFMKFCRQNCLLYWLRRTLVMAATIDRLTDKPEEAQHKLINALEFVKRRNSARIALSSVENAQNSDVSASDDFIVSKTSSTEVDSGVCLHGQQISVYDLKKKTMDLFAVPNDSEDLNLPVTDYFSSDPDDVPVYELDAARLDALIELVKVTIPVSVKRINTLNKIGITNNIRISLALIREVVKKIERPDSKKETAVFKESLETGRELISSRQRFDVNSMYLHSYAALDQPGKALTFAGSILNKKSSLRIDCLEGYCSRMQFAEFCVHYAKLLATPVQISTLAYNPAKVAESYLTRTGVSHPQRSPSPVRSCRRAAPPPKAPKGKNPFKMDEMNEYFKQLANEVSKERTVVRNEGPVPQSPVQIYKKFLDKSAMSPTKKATTFETSTRKVKPVLTVAKKTSSMVIPSSNANEAFNTGTDASSFLISVVNNLTEQDKNNFHAIVSLLMKYLGNHPPVHIHRELMFLVSAHHFAHTKDLFECGYFLSERVSTAFRYHAMKICSKRQSKKSAVKYAASSFEFQPASYSELITPTLKECPRGWRILQIVTESGKKPGPDLLLTRYEHEKQPVSIRICSDEWKHKRNFMDELQEIIELSNNSILNKDPESFWSLRTSLDNRMRKLTVGVEKAWLGPFIGFMLGRHPSSTYQKLVSATVREIMTIAELTSFCCRDPGILELLIESSPVLSEEDFCSAIGMLFSFDGEFMCRCYNIVQNMVHRFCPDSDPRSIFMDYKTSPVGLVLGMGLELFPWESLPTPRESRQEFFRIPSFRFLSAALQAFKKTPIFAKGADSNKTFYLLNPTNNLSKTEDRFRDKFGGQSGWKGCVGEPPEPQVLAEGLEKEDIYIFFGHGAGATYYRSIPNHLEGVDLNTASLVIGCSSGRLRHEGKDLEPYGIPYRFLLNGSPAYVGVLWDVTDIDIDTFADDMLGRWMPQWKCRSQIASQKEGVSVCRATAEARNACKLKYLIGAAPVVYGLPVFARKGTD
jgi:separase